MTLSHMLPDDWGCGFYPEGMMQEDIVKRLLMNGEYDIEDTPHGGIIPYGNVWGLGYTWAGTNRVWSLGLRKVGLKDMNRQPKHQ